MFVYGTGNSISLAERFHIINGVLTSIILVPVIAGTFLRPQTSKRKKDKKLKSCRVFSIDNMYNHLNPYFTYYNQKDDSYSGNMKIEAGQVSLVPVIRTVTWNFKF